MSKTEAIKKGQTPEKREKKELTPNQKKWKTALGWIVNIVCIAIILFSLIVAIFTIVRTTNDRGIANLFGTVFMAVKSDSMSGTFEEGDMILADVYEGDGSDLKVGQVITFKISTYVNGVEYADFNTHRITSIDKNGIFRTKGDKPGLLEDGRSVNPADVVATWGTPEEDGKVWKGMGKLNNWLEDVEKGRTRFFCAIVLPLILLFVLYAFILVRTLVIAKIDSTKAAAEAAAAPITADSLSDEEKRRLAEEYLASLAKSDGGDTPPEDPANENAADDGEISK